MSSNLNIIRRIVALRRLLGSSVVPDVDGFLHDDDRDDRSERAASFHPTTGAVRLTTWQTSYHNGDAYDVRVRDLDDDEGNRVLGGIVRGLEVRALEAERRRLEQAAEKRRAAREMKRLKRLGG